MLTRMFRNAVAADPVRAAVVQGSRRIRYDELDALAGRAASGLRRLGVGVGDCVAVVLPNGPEFVASLFACARLRAVLLPLHPRCTGEEIRYFLDDARARVVVTDAPGAHPFPATGTIVAEFDSLLEHAAESPLSEPFDGPCLYLYTTGSTAARKRVCCTQRNLYYEALNFVETVGLTAEDNILGTIPFSHSYGLGNCLLDAVYAGSTLVLPESENVPFAAGCRRLFELVREEAVRFYPGVPYQFEVLAALPGPPRDDLAGLRLCVSSGDVLPQRTFERFLERYGVPIRSLYGSTEAGSIAINTDPAAAVRFGSLGPPLQNVTIRIRDDVGRDLPVGEVGRIWVKSPVIPPTGYDKQPKLSVQVFRDGFYNTGDLGKLDARGDLVMTGRKQTFIEVGGYKVDLSEVEEVLRSCPGVTEAAAVGIAVPGLGTLVKAVVVADGPCTEVGILAYCGERLAAFKVPRLVQFRDALPRGPLGKILRSELGDLGDYPAGANRADFERAWLTVADREPLQRLEFLAARVQEQVALTLQCEPRSVDRSASFRDMGLDSLQATELHLRLLKLTGLPLSITLAWNYPSVDELAAALLAHELSAKPSVAPEGRWRVAPGESSSPGISRAVWSGISPGGAAESNGSRDSAAPPGLIPDTTPPQSPGSKTRPGLPSDAPPGLPRAFRVASQIDPPAAEAEPAAAPFDKLLHAVEALSDAEVDASFRGR
jgi:long-chain acyl-CoA synthetase